MKNLRKDTHGVASLVLIIVAVVVLAIAGTGWYLLTKDKDSDNGSNAGTSAQTASEATNDECLKAIDDNDFCKFASNFKLPDSYKATIVSKDGEGTSTSVIETSGPKQTRITTSQDDKEVSAIVIIDDTTYSKDYTDGQWFKLTSPSQDTGTPVTNPDISFKDDPATDAQKDKIQYKKLNKEACGDLTCFKYQIIEPDKADNEQYVWFDDKDYLLRRWMSKTSDGSTDMTYSYEQVTITEPSPVKESPSLEGMSQERLQQYLSSRGGSSQ